MSRRALILATALAVLAALWFTHQRHASQVIEKAVTGERQRISDLSREALASAEKRALAESTAAALAALELQHDLSTARQQLETARSDLRAERQRLRDATADFRARAVAEGARSEPGSVAHGAVAVADALDECSGRYEAVAGVADTLAVQVTGLQRYITDVVGPVCLKEPDHDG